MANSVAAALGLYLKLDQIINTTTVVDLSVKSRNGTIHGAPQLMPQAQLGGCISFNGSTDYIEVPDPFDASNTTFTISLWVQPNQINTGGYRGIIGKQDTLRKPGLWLGPGSGQLHYFSHDPTGQPFMDLLNNFFLSTDEWVHIAWVKNGTQYLFYRNGVLFATKTAPAQLYASTTTDYWIGMVDNAFAGQIADLRIYDQALTVDNIVQDMKADQTASLALYLKLDQITNATVSDLSGNARNGTIHGNPMVVPQTQLGGCISFNGSTDYIEVPDPFVSLSTAFTLSLWVQPNQINTGGYHGIIGKQDTLRKPGLWMGPGNGQLHYYSQDPTGQTFAALLNNFFLLANEWVHIAWVKDGTQYRFYRNGTLFASATAPAQIYTSTTTDYWIGMVDNAFAGQIADLRVYNQALTADSILRDLQADQTSSAAFRMTYPLDFTVTNSDAQPVLAITDDPTGQSAYVNITNTSRQNIVFTVPTNTTPSATNCHFELRLRPGTLATATLSQIILSPLPNWLLSTVPQPDGTVSLCLLSTSTLTLASNQTLSFLIQRVKIDGTGGSRGTRTELRYNLITYQNDTTPLTGSRTSYLSIVNQVGQKSIPLHVGFIGPDTILNDGVTANRLTLRITNVSKSPISLNPSNSAAPSYLTLSCDVQPQGTSSTALTTMENAASIVLALADIHNTQWTIPARPEIAVTSIEWLCTPLAALMLSPSDYIEISLTGIVSPLPNGPANLILRYQNIPGYWDGQFVVTPGKAPLIYSQNSVGIGTIAPRTALDTGKGVLSGAANDYQKAQWTLTGGGTVTWKNSHLKWTGNFHAISMGIQRSLGAECPIPDGYIKLGCPTGTIPANCVYDGNARTITTDGIPLNTWEAIYAVHNIGGHATDFQYQIVRFTADFFAPSNWLLVALVNDNDNTVKMGTGVFVAPQSSSTAGSSIPVGAILMWSGQVLDIPGGWSLCDGTNGTPDLRERFLLGAGAASPYDLPGTQGEATQHNHAVTLAGSVPTSQNGSHTHSMPSAWYDRNALDDIAAAGKSWYSAIDRGGITTVGAQTGANGDHTHAVGINLSTTTAASAGDYRPRWYALCFIMKL